jgi:hypothetical protein
VCHAKLPFSQILSAINGNLVGLCSYTGNDILVPDDPQLPSVVGQQPVCPCLGFGIVRGIDMQQKRLYIIKPVPESVLNAVNCLILGTIMLPSYVYWNASEHKDGIPYMATGPDYPLSKESRRVFRPLQPICGTQKQVAIFTVSVIFIVNKRRPALNCHANAPEYYGVGISSVLLLIICDSHTIKLFRKKTHFRIGFLWPEFWCSS